jgi:hypothetical protein
MWSSPSVVSEARPFLRAVRDVSPILALESLIVLDWQVVGIFGVAGGLIKPRERCRGRLDPETPLEVGDLGDGGSFAWVCAEVSMFILD